MNKTELVVCGVPFEKENDEKLLDILGVLKRAGVTSIQIYTFWNRFEPEKKGVFHWSHYDRQVELLRKAGLKYVPFFLMGPRYAAPDWWLASPDHRGLYCLEHHKYNPCESIWSEAFRREIDRVMGEFSAHYGPMDVIESFQPGICGDYGESMMPDMGNWPGAYHSHRGNWSDGEDARADFTRWLRERFGTVEALNSTWRSHYTSLDEVGPITCVQAPSRTAYFDYLEWYRGAITNYTEFWLQTCRKHFPDTPVYMCTGGMEQPEHATSIADQARICAKYGCGIRLTNEENKFYENFLWTSVCKSACEQYGAYLGLEPVGPINAGGVTTRIFGSAAYGNRQMFNYYSNLCDGDKLSHGGDNFRKYIHLVQKRDYEPAIAVFWPNLFASFFAANPDNPNDMTNTGVPKGVKDAVKYLRRQRNVLPVNEVMVMDGGLDRFTTLVCPLAAFTRAEVLRKIARWVENGGTLIAAGVMRDLENGDVPEYIEALGLTPEYELLTGHHEQQVRCGDELPAFKAIGQYHSSMSIIGLQDSAVILSSSVDDGAGFAVKCGNVVSAAEYRFGKGRTVLWLGPIAFEDDPNAIFPDVGSFRALLTDIIAQNGETRDLTPAKGEVVRAVIGGTLMALTEKHEIISLE